MTVSLDGFVNDRHGSVDPLYGDLEALDQSQLMRDYVDNTGAVVMGWKAYRMADDPDWFLGNYEFQKPIFVLTHEVPARLPKQDDKLTFTFVTDGIECAIRQAKKAAGDRNVMVIGGATTAQRCLAAGLVDELYIDIMPVLLVAGQRLFEHIGDQEIQLERTRVVEFGARTHLEFRVLR
jgi:dihydrofolate reductase